MKATATVVPMVVTEGDRQVASQVGLHLLGELADRTGLSSGYSAAVPWKGERAPGQDRGRLLAQLSVMLAGGGVCIDDLAALRDQPDLFGTVASPATVWRAVQGTLCDSLHVIDVIFSQDGGQRHDSDWPVNAATRSSPFGAWILSSSGTGSWRRWADSSSEAR